MSILVTSKKLSNCEKQLAILDLEEVHKIRGRILHLSSILEQFFSEFVTKQLFDKNKSKLKIKKKFKKLDFSDRIIFFISEIKSKYSKDKSFQQFKRDIKILRKDYRNLWAHGFIFYERYELDKKDNKYKPINYISDGKKKIAIHYKTDYFEIANRIFPNVVNWLKDNHFLKLKKFSLS